MSNVDVRLLFERRPVVATVGLAVAGASAVATFFQAVTVLFTVSGFYFDFVYRTSTGAGGGDPMFSTRMAFLVIGWALLLLIACYRALMPRPVARFAVITLIGLKLIAFIGAASSMSTLQYLLLLAFASAPIILLLMPSSNRYYSTQF